MSGTNCCQFDHRRGVRDIRRWSQPAEALGEFAVVSALRESEDTGEENDNDEDAVPLDRVVSVATPMLWAPTGIDLGAVTLIVAAVYLAEFHSST